MHRMATILAGTLPKSGLKRWTEKAVEQMGHRSPTMLYRHYRKLIGRDQAQAFFEIFPGEHEGGYEGEKPAEG